MTRSGVGRKRHSFNDKVSELELGDVYKIILMYAGDIYADNKVGGVT